MNHDEVFYEHFVDGVPFDPWCFSLPFGKNPLEPGSSNVGDIGFFLPVDPATSDLELGVLVPRSVLQNLPEGAGSEGQNGSATAAAAAVSWRRNRPGRRRVRRAVEKIRFGGVTDRIGQGEILNHLAA